ncbi:hypothetical protein PG996_006208 [Apiospora saccharicola]|uniref:Uncharacterized protein n=1 Tax=Apiospora saccharicola TaxID=335842 RepID=A0ABR1VRN8_9PEZI
MGRNEQELARLKAHVERGLIYGSRSSGLIETVPITGDEAVDTAALRAFGTIDAVLDFSPSTSGRGFVDTRVFKLEQVDEALDMAAEHTGGGRAVVFAP